jgi:hypothetical protein
MKNKLIIAALYVLLTGCASMYAGWEKVNIVDSVFNKPCSYVTEYSCSNAINPTECYKQVANIDKANTVVMNPDGKSAKSYNCSSGNPLNFDGGKPAWTVRNIYNPAATKLDLDKAESECTYQAHVATVDTSRVAPARIYINTSNFYINNAQLSAMTRDEINNDMHDIHLSVESSKLQNECLKAKGFVYAKSANKTDYDDIKRACPGADNTITPCFIPGAQK